MAGTPINKTFHDYTEEEVQRIEKEFQVMFDAIDRLNDLNIAEMKILRDNLKEALNFMKTWVQYKNN